MIADSAMGMSTGTRMRTFALEKIILINTLLGQENMDAGRIKNAQKEVVAFGELMVAPLKEITLDNQLGRKVHTTAMSLMGRLNNAKAADAILELMAQSVDPEVKIEGLIAMEKNKELRAGYLLKQLANDPNESVAFTAAEVFRKLEKLMPKDDLMQAPRSSVLALSIPESKIGEDDSGAVDTVAPAPDTTAKPATADSVVTIKATNTKPQSKIAQMIFMLKDDELVPVPAKSTGDTAVKVDSLKKTAADTVSKTPKAPVKADSVALKSADTVKAPVSPVKPVDTLKPLAPTTPARPAVPEKKK
jgi:hypothetical protein